MTTTPNRYNEQTYGPPYNANPRAISPNALNTAADFVSAFCVWVRNNEQEAGEGYRAQLKATAHLLERTADATGAHHANAYSTAARRLRALSRDHDHTATAEATAASARDLSEELRARALTEHQRHTERAEEYEARRNARARRSAERAARAYLKNTPD